MKTLLLTALLFVYHDSLAQKKVVMKTQNEESAKIAQVLEDDYFAGIYTGDVDQLRKIYHPGTLLFGDVKGLPYAKTLSEYLEGVAKRQSPRDSDKPFKGEVLNIRVTNSIAVAEVKVKMYDFVYKEYLSFHKIDGKWLLINKMISDIANNTEAETAAAGDKFSLIATLEVLPGFEAAVKKALVAMTAETLKEPGVEQFLISTKEGVPQSIVIYEVYQSKEAFEAHKATSHASAFFALIKGKIKDDKIGLEFLTAIAQ